MGDLASWRGGTGPGGLQGLWAPPLAPAFGQGGESSSSPLPVLKRGAGRERCHRSPPRLAAVGLLGRRISHFQTRWRAEVCRAGQRCCPGTRHALAWPLSSAQPRFSVPPWASGVGAWRRVESSRWGGTGSGQPRGLRAALQALFLPHSPRTPCHAAQPSPDEGTPNACVPSHPWPCPVLGASHPAAPGERGRSLSLFQVRLGGRRVGSGQQLLGCGKASVRR